MNNPFETARRGIDRISAVFYVDDDGQGWWQLAIVQPGGFVRLVRTSHGPLRYPNGQQHLVQAVAAKHGWPVVEFNAGPYPHDSLLQRNEAWQGWK